MREPAAGRSVPRTTGRSAPRWCRSRHHPTGRGVANDHVELHIASKRLPSRRDRVRPTVSATSTCGGVLLAVGIVCAMIAAMALAVLLADRRRERRRREQRYRDLDMEAGSAPQTAQSNDE